MGNPLIVEELSLRLSSYNVRNVIGNVRIVKHSHT